MVVPDIRKVVIIGAGRLATHFGIIFKENGLRILQVYNRTPASGKALATLLSSDYINDFLHLSMDADLYCVAVSDSAIEQVAAQIVVRNKLIIHFSGTVGIESLHSCSGNYGVLYPPQTFTRNAALDFRAIPLCLEANNKQSEKTLLNFASLISDKVIRVTAPQRKAIHLSAVFANNFTNLMYSISECLLRESGLSIELLKPLIDQTAANIPHENVFSNQTGPAIREDYEVIRTHLDLLADIPEYQAIYQLLSDEIIRWKYKNDKL